MRPEELEQICQENGFSTQELSQMSGVPVSTIQEMYSGKIKLKQEQWFRLEQSLEILIKRSSASSLRENAYAYEVEPDHGLTVTDYYALPNDQRVELIDGRIYNMAAPSVAHQDILTLLVSQFIDCVEKYGDGCRLFFAPCDVQLDKNEKTMVQPDLLVVCNPELLRDKRCIFGAPDLVLEITSPSTVATDKIIKLGKYYGAGVREYWIVDPEKEKVLVYNFTVDKYDGPEIYSFDSIIPIHISEGKCRIDFSRIKKNLLKES